MCAQHLYNIDFQQDKMEGEVSFKKDNFITDKNENPRSDYLPRRRV